MQNAELDPVHLPVKITNNITISMLSRTNNDDGRPIENSNSSIDDR